MINYVLLSDPVLECDLVSPHPDAVAAGTCTAPPDWTPPPGWQPEPGVSWPPSASPTPLPGDWGPTLLPTSDTSTSPSASTEPASQSPTASTGQPFDASASHPVADALPVTGSSVMAIGVVGCLALLAAVVMLGLLRIRRR